MEEIEVPTEHLHEHLHEEAEHSRESWIMMVALTAAILAVLAAISSLLAGHHANEAMIDQIKSSDQWAFYQAKGIKSAILENKTAILSGLGKNMAEKDLEKIKEYTAEQNEIQKKALEMQKSSEQYMAIHHKIAQSVTISQIAIAICAIAALTRKKLLWYSSILLGIIGALLLLISFL